MSQSPVTTHVLDTSKGTPGMGIKVVLEIKRAGDAWETLGEGVTDDDGRIGDLLSGTGELEAGIYRITFDTGDYFRKEGLSGFYPYASICFEIEATDEHYHVPLLLNPFGYSTYRGS